MPAKDAVRIGRKTLAWAMKRADLTHEQVAKALGKGYTANHVMAWESGDALPTFVQAERIAEKLKIPLGVLFMEAPPDLSVPIPYLRTVTGEPPTQPSIAFFEVIGESRSRQLWYREFRQAQRAPVLPFVGRFKLGDEIGQVASDMALTLKITNELRNRSDSWEKFLNECIQHLENAGILVMRSAWVKHSHTRGLNVEEFRGFALSDRLAPLVFINGADAKAAQIFTLAHEAAHIWIGQSGISNPDPKKRATDYRNPIERYCNAVAAEFLIPAANFSKIWRNGDSAVTNVGRIATFHRVSKIASAIRARDLHFLSLETANQIIDSEYERFRQERAAMKEQMKDKEGGPGFWRGFTERVSARFSEAVFGALDNGQIIFRDAANLLGIKLSTLDKHPLRSTHT